jgi:hypothetical protein
MQRCRADTYRDDRTGRVIGLATATRVFWRPALLKCEMRERLNR